MKSRDREVHRTASIRRPRAESLPEPTRAARRAGRGGGVGRRALEDLTRPLPADKRLVSGARNRTMVGLAAVAIIAALLAALFVLPVRAWLDQRDDIATRAHDLQVIRDSNARLQAEITRLNTDDGARQAARELLGYIQRGERRYLAVGDSTLSFTLPSGWPYDTVGRVLVARGAVLAPASPSPASPSPGS